MIDLKTLYEQTTMYCELIETKHEDVYHDIEIYHQLDTPIFVYVYWDRYKHTIHSIVYTIKGE